MCIVLLLLCIYVVIIYSLLELVFHVRISHILLQNDLKRQFFFGGFAPIPHGDAVPPILQGGLRGPLDPRR